MQPAASNIILMPCWMIRNSFAMANGYRGLWLPVLEGGGEAGGGGGVRELSGVSSSQRSVEK